MNAEEEEEEDKLEDGKRTYNDFMDSGSEHSIMKVLTRLNRK